MHIVLLSLLAGLVFSASPFSADVHSFPDRPTVEVWAIATSPDGFTPAQQGVMDAFDRAILAAGLDQPGGMPRTLLVDAIELEVDGETRLVVSVTVMSQLPEEVVSVGANAEAFYLTGNLAGVELPEEGSEVRRDVSANWLRQFHTVDYLFVEVLTPGDLERRATEIVTDL